MMGVPKTTLDACYFYLSDYSTKNRDSRSRRAGGSNAEQRPKLSGNAHTKPRVKFLRNYVIKNLAHSSSSDCCEKNDSGKKKAHQAAAPVNRLIKAPPTYETNKPGPLHPFRNTRHASRRGVTENVLPTTNN